MKAYPFKSYILLFIVFVVAVGLAGLELKKTFDLLNSLNSQELESKNFYQMKNQLSKNQAIKPAPAKKLVYYRHGSRSQNEVSLTFDDGPSPVFTPKVLDILKQYNVRATFFVLGKWGELYPDIIKREQREGHLIANHSYSHSKDIGDFERADEFFSRIIGSVPRFLRPPYGELKLVDKKFFEERKIIDWDVEARDWERPRPEIIVQRIVFAAQNGSIILLHDGSQEEAEQKERPQNMVLALPKIIEELQKKFQLVRVDELDLAPLTYKTLKE